MDRREERRLVACLFIDVVGSTELTLRLGPERLKSALGSAFGELRALIEREGGTVEKYVGDAIYALFGAPIAHEDDPARALRAADAARRWARSRRGADVPFDVRVGLEVGEAVVDLAATEGARQQMSVGAVVNVAARLEQHAEPGQVLVGPLCHDATREIAAFHSLGDVELKGVGRLPVWSLEEIRGEARRQRLPFVGRQGELELLALAYRRARSRSVLVLVSGPPGQGKTRLVEELLSSLGVARVLKARCRPGGEVGVFVPLRELLLGDGEDAALEVVVAQAIAEPAERARVREALAHSAGIAASEALVSIGKDEREDEIQNGWRRFVRGLATQGPLVIWVEDVHWAAPEVVRLVDRLSLSGDPVLVIMTARPEFAESAGLRPSGDRFFVEVEALDLAAARTLAESAGGSTAEVVARAEGNPLFIVELARARGGAGDLPLTLQGALGARLDELDSDDRALLAHAAIVGETFAPEDAAVLLRADGATTGRALSRLVDRHYLDALDGRYRFHHSLLRDVAYGRLLVADRMRLHARYARSLAERGDPEVLAHHWWAALGGLDAEWVWRGEPDLDAMRREAFTAQLKAGVRHAELFAVERAIALLERAFALAGDEHDRGVARLAEAEAYANDLRGDDSWRTYGAARGHFTAAGKVPPELYLGALKVRMRVGAFNTLPPAGEVKSLVTEAEAAARASGDRAVLARTLVYSAFKDMDPATMSGDRVRVDEAVALSVGTDPATRREILGWYAGELIRTFELDRALKVFDEIGSLPGEMNELDRMEYLRGRAILTLRAGDLPGLEALTGRIVAMSQRMGPHLKTHANVFAAHLALARADWARALTLGADTDHLIRDSPGTAFCSSAAVILVYGAVAQARAGRPDEARALLARIPYTTVDDISRRDLADFALVFVGVRAEGALPSNAWGAVTAVVSGAHDRALAIAVDLAAQSRGGALFFAALAEAIREEVARDRGGLAPKHAALRAIGYLGWSELLSSRVATTAPRPT